MFSVSHAHASACGSQKWVLYLLALDLRTVDIYHWGAANKTRISCKNKCLTKEPVFHILTGILYWYFSIILKNRDSELNAFSNKMIEVHDCIILSLCLATSYHVTIKTESAFI